MRVRFVVYTVFAVGATCALANLGISAQTSGNGRSAIRSHLPYSIVDNYVDPSLGSGDPDRRFISVFMDGKRFSRDVLLKTFKAIASRFPAPELLYINLGTSREEVQTKKKRLLGLTTADPPAPTPANGTRISNATGQSAVFVRREDGTASVIISSGNDWEEVEVK